MIRLLLIAVGVIVASWAVLVVLARRLPPGAAKDLATVLPASATTARRLRKDPRVPRKAKLAVGFAALWVLSPIDPLKTNNSGWSNGAFSERTRSSVSAFKNATNAALSSGSRPRFLILGPRLAAFWRAKSPPRL